MCVYVCSRNERQRRIVQPSSSQKMMLQLLFLESESTKCANLNPNHGGCMLVCDGQPLPCNVVEDIINLFIERSKAFFYGIDQVSK